VPGGSSSGAVPAAATGASPAGVQGLPVVSG
jgi:hypothetical protein